MLASQQCLNGDFDVLVIRCCNANDIDILTIKQITIVTVNICFTFPDPSISICSLRMPLADVSNCNNITETSMLPTVTASHSTKSNATYTRSIILGLIRKYFFSPRKISSGCGRGSCCSRRREKRTA